MYRALFYLSFLLCCCAQVASARTGSISGRVTDASGKAVSFANIVLLRAADTTVIKAEAANEKGDFSLTLVEEGVYLVKVLCSGYDTYTSGRVEMTGDDIALPAIVLQRAGRQLKEVTVSGQKPFIEVRPDKLVVNVENSILSAGSSVMEVLQRSPGVRVDQNDNISLKGKAGVNVMIDGKIQPLSAEELANMLKSMPASTVDKIELISNPSARYDAAGTAGIINIRMKKDQRLGLNGNANASYMQSIYHGQTAGLNLNYRNKRFNAYAGLSYYKRIALNDVAFYRKFSSNDTFTGAYDQHNYTTGPAGANTLNTGIDYSVSDNTKIGVSLKGQINTRVTNGYYHSRVLNSSYAEDSYFTTVNTSDGTWYNYAPNLHFQHIFDTTGKELTADLDYGRYTNSSVQDFLTNYYLPGGTPTLQPYMLHGEISGLTQIRAFKMDFVHPFKDGTRAEAGIKSSKVTADNYPKFFDRSNGGDVYDSGKSNHFIYTEHINAAYVSASKDWTKWSTQLGLRAEQTIATGDERTYHTGFGKRYIKFFPNLAAQRHMDKNNDLGLTLSRRIERPNYQQLNPYTFYVDPSTFRAGNPYLDPGLSYNIELSHIYKQRLITTLYYSVTNNVIVEIVQPAAPGSRVAKQTESNLKKVDYYGMSGSYTIPITRWWNNVTNMNLYYNKYDAYLANTALTTGRVSYDVNMNNSFLLPEGFSAEVSAYYQSLQAYGYLNIKPNWMLNLGIQKNLLSKQLTIKLNAADIFYTAYHRAYSHYTGYDLNFTARHDSRIVSISATYRFGNRSMQTIGRHKAGAEEEQKRAEGSVG